jgi:hypothetical protein
MDLSKLSDAELLALSKKPPKQDLSSISDEDLLKLAGKSAPVMSKGEAARIGLERGATLGTRPTIEGAGGAVGRALGTFSALGKTQPDMPIGERISSSFKAGKEAFGEVRERSIGEQEQALRDQPGAAMVGDIAGSVLTAPLTPLKALKGASTAARLARVAGQGAIGATGEAIGSARSKEEAAGMVALGAAAGPILSAGASAIAKAGKSIGKSLGDFAKERAYKALGGSKGHLKKVGEQTAKAIGEFALDEKIVSLKPKTISQMQDIAEAKTREIGGQIGDAIKKAGEKGFSINKKKVAEELLIELVDESEVGNPQMNKLVKERIDHFLASGDKDSINIATAQQLKSKLGAALRKGGAYIRRAQGRANEQDAIEFAIYDKFKERIQDVVELAGTSDKGMKKLGQEYFKVNAVADLLEDQYAKEIGNRMFSPSDQGWAATSALLGLTGGGPAGALLGIPVGLAHKVVRERGAGPAAAIARGLVAPTQSILGGTGRAVGLIPPAFAGRLGAQMIKKDNK